ncbi:PH domain-containing protein [Neisseria montereyensis]|uniref:PH domain-containing protein n=1 Tax=Neisseria montereyensis TaxID=2973938 RepID=A0ABT2FDI3_9NEIS|nr:PH domain-containing protein [Neisseria montereyensis]MCS4533986.1 PH domain-containing protein [Neisseria montereyensis]
MAFGLGKLVQGMLGNMSEISLEELEQQFGRYLFEGEKISIGYKLIRDLIVFTDQRILFIDKQGATGKKQSFKSIYLMNIVDVEMETAGMGLDDSELTVTCLQSVYRKAYNEQLISYTFEFPKSTDIVPLYTMLGSLVLQNRQDINNQH